MNALYKTYAYFSVSDFECDFTEITKFIGLEPTEAFNKNDYLPIPNQPHIEQIRRHSSWKLHSPKPTSEILLIAT
jgi:Domain of unknown function (DUF4279)